MKEKKDLSGVLFRNAKKEQLNHSDYNGDITIHGETFWLSAWIKEYVKDGKPQKYMSLAVKAKEQKPKPLEDDPAFADDSIPF